MPSLTIGLALSWIPTLPSLEAFPEMQMSVKAKKVSDSEVDDLERLVPDRAMDATLSAYFRAVSMTQSGVLRTDAGNLVRVARDGSKTVVAKAKPRRKVTVGEVITVRRVGAQAASDRA
jgi:hypothetical protein